nr:receptor-like protein 12 [Tanacetum cinerariifolium]
MWFKRSQLTYNIGALNKSYTRFDLYRDKTAKVIKSYVQNLKLRPVILLVLRTLHGSMETVIWQNKDTQAVSSNRFSGVIPETIGRLKALYLLNVSHNEFTGSIPPSVANLRQLESLDMSRNKLTGNIPSILATLPFLSSFNVSYNRLEGRISTGNQF